MEDNRTNIKVYYRNELLCTLYDEDFEENSLEVSGSALGSNGFNIGGATSNQSSLTLTKVGLKKMRENNALRRKARLDIETFEGINNSAGYKYNLGKFYVTELTVGDYSADLVLYDGMVSFDDTISEEDLKVVQTTENTIVGWVNWVMGKCSSPFYQINLDTNTINADMPNGGILFKITDDSRIDTYRNMLELLSVLAGGYFKIDRYGKLYYGNFKNIETGRFINETVVTDYNEDAYPCFVRKLKTSVAGFDHAVGNTNVPEGHDELELAVYENPFLRSKVTEEDKYLPAEVQGIINTMSDPVVGKKLTGGSVSYMSGYGKLGHLSELIEVRRNVIPYGGESATQLLTSKLLVTDFTYQYKNSITLKCNASVANINPSSSGLNKGVGYSPTNKAYDNRLDEIANNLEEISTRITDTYNNSFFGVGEDVVKNTPLGFSLFWVSDPISISGGDYSKMYVDINSIRLMSKLHIPDIKRIGKELVGYSELLKYIPDYSFSEFGGYASFRRYHLDYDGLGGNPMELRCICYDNSNNIISTQSVETHTDKEEDTYISGGAVEAPVLSDGDSALNFGQIKEYNDKSEDYLNRSPFNIENASKRKNIEFNVAIGTSYVRFGLYSFTSIAEGAYSKAQDIFGVGVHFTCLLRGTYSVNGKPTRCVADWGSLELQDVPSAVARMEEINTEILKKSKFSVDIDITAKSSISGDPLSLSRYEKTTVRNPNTVQIITDRIKGSSTEQDIELINSVLDNLSSIVNNLVTSVSILEGQNLYETVKQIGGTLVTVKDTLTKLEERVKALEGGTTPSPEPQPPSDITEQLDKINKRIDSLSSTVALLSKLPDKVTEIEGRLDKLEGSSSPQEPTTSGGINVAYYYNSSLVGVSQGKTEFAKLKLDLNNGVVPVLNVSANASVVQNGTLTFEVLLDGSKMPLNPKFLLSKPTEFISFSLPFLEISEGKLYDLSLLCSTEDSEVNFNPNDIAISVINAKLAKSSTSFDEKVKPFTISSSNIKLSTITENISTTK